MTNPEARVGGIDSHKDTIHVAVITDIGHPVDDKEFSTTQAGYRRAVAWLIEHGPLAAVGVEGTSSYGRGISTELTNAGIKVVEVNRTRPAERRKQGKTDALDAYRAARSVLSGEASTDPKAASIEPLRALTVARRSARKAQQATWRQIGALLVNAPGHIRAVTGICPRRGCSRRWHGRARNGAPTWRRLTSCTPCGAWPVDTVP